MASVLCQLPHVNVEDRWSAVGLLIAFALTVVPGTHGDHFLWWSWGWLLWRASPMAQQNPPAMQETQKIWVLSLVGKIPWRREWQPMLVFWLVNLMDREAWWATVHGVTKSQTWWRDGAHACIMECLAVCSGGQVRIWGGGSSRGSRRAGTRVSHPCGGHGETIAHVWWDVKILLLTEGLWE